MPATHLISITPLYAIPLILIFFVLWMGGSAKRSALDVSIGDGANPELLLRMRRHGNFIEWVPFVLVLMLLAELLGAPAGFVHAAGVLLVIGRLVHPFGLKAAQAASPLRIIGNSLNLLAVLNLLVCLIWRSVELMNTAAL